MLQSPVVPEATNGAFLRVDSDGLSSTEALRGLWGYPLID